MAKKIKIGRENENWLAKYFYRKAAAPLVTLLAKLGFTSVHVSVMGIFTSMIAGAFFSFGDLKCLVFGYVFLQFTLILDHVDGAIARYTNNQTMVGSWFDKFSNKLHRFFFVLGISIGIYKMTGQVFYLILGNIAGFLWIFSVYISETRKMMFSFKKDLTIFKEGKSNSAFPFTLLVTNIFGLLVIIKPSLALWFVSIISLNAFRQIYSVNIHYQKEKYKEIKNK